MRTKLLIAAVLLMSILFLGSMTEKEIWQIYQFPPSPLPDNGFILGAMANAWDLDQNYSYDSIGFNTWHIYTNPRQGWLKKQATHQFHPDDTLGGNMSSYGPNVQAWISDNNSKGIRTLMDRPTIEYLAYGQRSDYQAEEEHTDADYWFYTYHNSRTVTNYIEDINDNSSYGGGVRVKTLHTKHFFERLYTR